MTYEHIDFSPLQLYVTENRSAVLCVSDVESLLPPQSSGGDKCCFVPFLVHLCTNFPLFIISRIESLERECVM